MKLESEVDRQDNWDMQMQTKSDETFDVHEVIRRAEARAKTIREELNDLERIIGAVSPITRTKIPKVDSFKGWTIPQCAKQLIREAGTSLTSGQMLREMLVRGWTTTSKRPITVIHSGLSESPYIQRVGKRWDLSKKGSETEF